MKKIFCGRPGEDFSRHPHFQKQEYFFFDLRSMVWRPILKLKNKTHVRYVQETFTTYINTVVQFLVYVFSLSFSRRKFFEAICHSFPRKSYHDYEVYTCNWYKQCKLESVYMRFHFEWNEMCFHFGIWLISYNCLHDTTQNETWCNTLIAGVISLRSFWQKQIFISSDKR